MSSVATRVRNVLWGASILLALASLAGQLVRLSTGHDRVFGLIPLLDVGQEANLPTWFSAVLLLTVALLLAVAGLAVKARREQWAGHWFALAGVFTLMSIDEIASVHERLGRLGGGDSSSDTAYLWVVPAAVLVVALMVAFLRFARSLPAATRRGFIIAGAVFVGAAVGGELVGEWVSRAYGVQGLAYVLTAHVEELLEMMGAVLFIEAVIAHLAGMGVSLDLGKPTGA